ncbi:MAG: hypothetical protein JNJ71_19850 [Rubrivivax sp.]|nr:hypothetical protein [Rubrivivax sp.]
MNLAQTLLALVIPGALLVGCGGGSDLPAQGADAQDRATIASAAAGAATASWPIAPLLADDGSVMPSSPQAVPADPAARTQAGRYASPAQAEQLERTVAQGLVRVVASGRSPAAADEDVGIVTRLLAERRLAASAPVLIEGADQRSAAALVDRLAAYGVSNTWLVTQ